MTIRIRGDWYWCERQNDDGTWDSRFVQHPNLDEWDHANAALYDDDPVRIVALGGKPGENYGRGPLASGEPQ